MARFRDWLLVAAIAAASLVIGVGAMALAGAAPAAAQSPPAAITALPGGLARPNIVFVLTDDLAMNLLAYMPNVQLMQQQGTSFSAYFVTDSLCCPSRSSIMTGQLPHNTGVFTNTRPDGGYDVFVERGNPAATFAVALQARGYHTAMLGKFLNGYEPKKNGPERGWSEWDVGGNGYREFNYDLNRNGTVQHYGAEPAAYLTDVANGIADGFIRKSAAAGAPFLVEIATFAPHGPYIPAPRDAQKFAGLKVPRTPAYGVRPDDNAPQWLKGIPALRPMEMNRIDADFRLRAQAVQAVDKMIGDLRATVAALGLADRTYFVFSSDNGYHMGDYSLRSGKQTPFDTDIHVPLVVVGPGVAKGAVRSEIVENIDLAPTFADLAGGPGPLRPDGVSLVPLLLGQSPAWRQAALVEHHHPGDATGDDPDAAAPNSANPPSYAALRTPGALYVEYASGEVGLYDLAKDPYELRNIAPTTAKAELARWKATLATNVACKGATSCWAAQSMPGPK
jgi:N-acetylglucosamine-6-sulfatase